MWGMGTREGGVETSKGLKGVKVLQRKRGNRNRFEFVLSVVGKYFKAAYFGFYKESWKLR